MNGYRLATAAFAFSAVAVSIWAIVAVTRSNELSRKPLWIIGSLLGFMGFGLNWTQPDDLILLFGFMIPPVMIFKIMPDGPIIVKTGFPIVAVIALWKMRSTGYIDRR